MHALDHVHGGEEHVESFIEVVDLHAQSVLGAIIFKLLGVMVRHGPTGLRLHEIRQRQRLGFWFWLRLWGRFDVEQKLDEGAQMVTSLGAVVNVVDVIEESVEQLSQLVVVLQRRSAEDADEL